MKILLFFLLLLTSILRADFDADFFEEENPAIFHHVHVISGDLQLSLQDAVIQAARPLPILRTYSSCGAYERTADDMDLLLKKIRGGFLVQGGWNIFPHANLLIEGTRSEKNIKIFAADKSGAITTYVYSHWNKSTKSKHAFYLRPEKSSSPCFGKIGGRSNPQNSYIHLDCEEGEISLYLGDGSILHYKGKKSLHKVDGNGQAFHLYYRLETETLPSKHNIHYSYDEEKRLTRIALTNPSNNKTFSWMNLDIQKAKTPYRFQVNTSDGKSIAYRFMEHKDRDYLCDVQSSGVHAEKIEYSAGRKGLGARAESLLFDGKRRFKAYYYLPPNEDKAEKWLRHPEKKPLHVDKVSRLEAPLGPKGETISLAQFTYAPSHTDVRDIDGLLIRYHHDGKQLTQIEYFGYQDRRSSITKFLWKENRLAAKIICNENGTPLFSKTFQYDSAGNVTEEVLFGNLSGCAQGPFSLTDAGALANAESFRKRYTYLPRFNVPLLEEEEDGLTYRYGYLPDTDLVTSKFTCDKEKTLIREFFFYNADNFLIAESKDDGSAADPYDNTNLHVKTIKRYQLSPTNGMPTVMVETYYDANSGKESPFRRTEYVYSGENRVIKETVYDEHDLYKYTISTSYDARGNVTSKTTPSGEENTYCYDSASNLLESNEIGSPRKRYTYDAANRPITCEEIDAFGERITTHTTYDNKSRPLSQTDHRGNNTLQSYDAFGRCLTTQFAPTVDREGTAYTPIAHFTYDDRGNIASTTTPRNETAQTFYTTLKNPYRMIAADGGETRHVYNKKGAIIKTIHPDGTEENYSYDILQRMTGKQIVSSKGEVLSQEAWTYSAFYLLSYTDPLHLVTTYQYDGAGRLLAEEAQGRKKTYSYDSLGLLEKTSSDGSTYVQIHDVEGRVTEQWQEDDSGRIENKMSFVYDHNNHKVQASRSTSQGNATDHFSYDGAGRLSTHTDPLGNQWKYLYADIINDLGQSVLQKTSIDPLGFATVETYDALNHLILIERQNTHKETVSKEQWYYDTAGNKAKRISTVYQDNTPTKQVVVCWEYDPCGRVTKEIEADKKTTLFAYDIGGRLISHTLPNSATISCSYDGLGRLLEQYSSDGTIHYQYLYKEGPDPVFVQDLIHNTTLSRHYNLFGELIEETTSTNLHYTWDYDCYGRCVLFTLPDHSSIRYAYDGMHMSSVTRADANNNSVYSHAYLSFDPNGHVANEKIILNLGTIQTEHDLLERPSWQSSPWNHASISYGPSSLVMECKNSLFADKTYRYDALNQLREERDITYHFDSLGNPVDFQVNDYNQILSTPDTQFLYDANGNPTQKQDSSQTTSYSYDALGRLISIISPTGSIEYTYDAFSRLVAKKTNEKQVLYLYDNTLEIGTISTSGDMIDLKILGLGIKADIGAAVAIEIDGQVFAPLHDFNGSIIALIAPNGTLFESYDLDAFGKETTSNPPINPWRFCSKRIEGDLIFFGLRFYSPSLGRWLTPDPSGFSDGPNLYAYVLNSPNNRLDLFGLHADSAFPGLYGEIPVTVIFPNSTPVSYSQMIPFKVITDGVSVDLFIACGHWHKLQVTPEELKTGKILIFEHLPEIIPTEGKVVGFVSAQNGVQTSRKEFRVMGESITNKIEEGTLFIGIYNPKHNIFTDLFRANKEIKTTKDTPTIIATRQVLAALSAGLAKISPDLIWIHINHSEAGVINRRAIEGMTEEQKAYFKEHFLPISLGPALPLGKNHALDPVNVYSRRDHVTKHFSKPYRNNPIYDIRFVEHKSSMWKQTAFIADHAFMGKTYQKELSRDLKLIKQNYGFYNGQAR